MKKFLMLLLVLTLAFCLFSCGSQTGDNTPCDEHVDENEDNICDVCEEKIEDTQGNGPREVKLFEDGLPVFQFVLDTELPTTIRLELNSIVKKIKKATGVSVEIFPENVGTPTEYEVLIGNVETRGEEYEYNYYRLGAKGKEIKIVGTKLIIAGGSEDSTLDLLDVFFEDFLKMDGDVLTEENVTVTEESCFYEPQTSFRISSISVGDTLMENHTIIVDKTNSVAYNAAVNIQADFYTYVGYWLPIVNQSDAQSTENAIVIKVLPKDGVSDGYKLYVDGASIVFEIMYDNKLLEKVNDFLAPIKLKSGDVKLTASTVNKTENIRVISYQDKSFGIDNTGETDASVQIKALHDYANMYGHDVKAGGGTYLIGPGNGSSPIVIKTNTDWTDAKFIIDDRYIEANTPAANASIITIGSSARARSYGADHEYVQEINRQIEENGGIDFPSLTNFFGFTFDCTSMVRVKNNNHKVYIRYGGNANDGAEQTEMIIVDKDGNIIDDSNFLLDYTEVTGITVYNVEEDLPITIKGGTFTTRANRAACSYSTGFSRNISIQRSNVTIKELTHKITDEGDVGPCYSSFLSVRYAHNVLIEDCIVQAHRMYTDETVLPDGTIKYGTSMGTYDLGCAQAVSVVFKNVNQSNYYDKNGKASTVWYDENWNTGLNNKSGIATLWGVMGSNYSKNITYDHCTLNRIDAHSGVRNVTVKNGSNVVHVALTGGGTALIENSNVDNTHFVNLREDYGSTWKGVIRIINSTLTPKERDSTKNGVYLITAQWNNHYFGYPCYLPNIELDNISVVGFDEIYIFDDIAGNVEFDATPDDDTDELSKVSSKSDLDATMEIIEIDGLQIKNNNPYHMPTYINIKNCDITFIGSSSDADFCAAIEALIKYED